MRKHSVRKWIHAILDMLPLVVIPIFAIYSLRHNIDNYSVTIQEHEVVDFNQYIENGKPLNSDYWVIDDGNVEIENGYFNIVEYGYVIHDDFDYDFISSHKFLFSCDYVSYSSDLSNDYLSFHIGEFSGDNYVYDFVPSVSTSRVQFIFLPVVYNNHFWFEISNDNYGYLSNVQLFDLSQMFGVGNEPTIEQFNSYFSNDYYDFTTSTMVDLVTGTNVYNDTDIGSQFMYQMYNVTNKYFNFNSVGNFNDIYGWFETNLFNGSAPLSFFIVWNIILYEFIMDLIFLTYMLFMFIIDFAEHMIDCFFDKSYRGGR